MVKFGKQFRKAQIKGWEEKYFNYKKFKQHINKLVNEKEKNTKDLNDIEKNEIINKWIKEFTDNLDKEIRIIYIFFSKNEKQLYKDINIYLHIKDDYINYDLEDYLKQYQELKKLSIFSLNMSKYVYYNLKALIKILKKFDKKIIGPKDKDTHIQNSYIIKKLEEQNSDILYLINFKMLDEVNVILEDLISCLKDQFKLRKNEFKSSFIEYIEADNSKEEELIDKKKVNKIDINQASIMMEEFHKKIKINIKNIDMIASEITKLFLPWKEFLRISGDVSSRLIQLSKELNSFSNSDEEGNMMFRNSKSIVETISFSKQNSYNIIITLYHAFLYMFSFSIIIPTYPELITYSMEKYDNQLNYNFYYGLLMMMAPIGALISYIYESNIFMITTKIPFVISSFGLILGNFLYFISGNLDLFFLLFIGRFLIGLFNLRTHNKMYIINFLLKKDVSFYLTMFHTFSMIGLGLGFLINICLVILFNDKDNQYINKYTSGPLLSTILCFILFILSIVFFTEARSNTFNITSMKSFISEPNKSFISNISSNENINSKNINDNNNHNVSNLIFEENINDEYSEELKNKANMVNDINAQLGDFNRMSNYNDTNLVSLSICELAYKEREKLKSLLSSFLSYLIIVFTTKYINESIFINIPIFIKDYNDKIVSDDDKKIKLWEIPLAFGCSCLIVLAIEFALRNKNKIISEKNLLIILFLLNLINDVILIFNIKDHSTIYFIIISLAIILSNIIEKYATHFFYSIIPEDYIVCKIQGNIFINVISMVSRIISSIFIICFKNFYNYEFIIYLSFIILSSICLILFLVFYSDIRIKSISRIMNKLGKNEIKVATEV